MAGHGGCEKLQCWEEEGCKEEEVAVAHCSLPLTAQCLHCSGTCESYLSSLRVKKEG